MESFRSVFKTEKTGLKLSTSSTNVFSAVTDVDAISKHRPFFESLYSRYPLECIDDMDAYFYFLLTRKICVLGHFIRYLEPDKADLLSNLLKDAMPLHESRIHDAIEFTNGHASEIFASPEQDEFGLRYAAADFITFFQKKIQPRVFECLCQGSPGIAVNYFERLQNVFDRNPALFSLLFPSGHLEDIKSLGLKSVLEIWGNKYGNQQYRQRIDSLLDVFCKDVWSLPIDKHEGLHILETAAVLKTVNSFLVKIKSPEANGLSEKVKKAEDLAWECLQHSEDCTNLSIKIPAFPIEKWKAEVNGRAKLLLLTHRQDPAGGRKYESLLSMKHEFSLVDVQFPAGEFLTTFQQNRLLFWAFAETLKFHAILFDDDAFDAYSELVRSEVKFIEEQLDQTENGLEKDAAFLLGMLDDVRGTSHSSAGQNEESCYGSSMFICSFIEKLLRVVYARMAPDEQYISDAVTLGDLLNKDNKSMVSLLGKEHLLSIGYFLIKTPQTNIGCNCRNALAHWFPEINPAMMNSSLVSTLLWLFTDVVNSVFLYFEAEKNYSSANETSGAGMMDTPM